MNGTYPQRIIVYRDGVGDGQLKTVLAHEVVQFQQAFQRISPDYKPRFTVIIVSKRINAKFFAMKVNNHDCDR
jgi:aubergine-like protein